MKYNITRKAILIVYPGSGNSFLRGVAEDLTNMENFLQSDKGGRCFPNEIVTLSALADLRKNNKPISMIRLKQF